MVILLLPQRGIGKTLSKYLHPKVRNSALSMCLPIFGSSLNSSAGKRGKGGYCIIASRLNTLEQHPPKISDIIAIHCGRVAYMSTPHGDVNYLRKSASAGGGRGILSLITVF